MATIKYRISDVDGFKVFYREAGAPSLPKLLLLHGFPSASHMFRDLIPLLADRFHIVAPDLPGFGMSDMPARERFKYTFDNVANVNALFSRVNPGTTSGHGLRRCQASVSSSRSASDNRETPCSSRTGSSASR